MTKLLEGMKVLQLDDKASQDAINAFFGMLGDQMEVDMAGLFILAKKKKKEVK